MELPHISLCMRLKKEIGKIINIFQLVKSHAILILDPNFDYMVEHQPIGKELFKQFCEKQVECRNCARFLEAVVSEFYFLIGNLGHGRSLSRFVHRTCLDAVTS